VLSLQVAVIGVQLLAGSDDLRPDVRQRQDRIVGLRPSLNYRRNAVGEAAVTNFAGAACESRSLARYVDLSARLCQHRAGIARGC